MGKPRIAARGRSKKQPELWTRLAAARERAEPRISRADMAKRLEWSEIKVWRIENGKSRLLAEDVAAYARILDLPVSRFYEDDAQ